MAKLVLGNTPKTFKRTVTVDMLDGTKGSIEVSYRYMTRTAFGAFLDGIFKDAGVAPEDAEAKVIIAEVMARTRDTNAEYLIKILDGWNLDEELSKANLQQLCDEFPGVANSVMETFRVAVTEGRRGN